MKPMVHLFSTLLLAAGIAAAEGGLPRAAHGQDDSDINDFEKDPFGASERMLNRMREYDRELQEQKRDAEQERERDLETNTGGRHLRDVWFVNSLYSLVFSSDGKRLFVGLADGSVCAADIESGKQVFSLKLANNPITTLAVSPDGRYLMAGCPADRLVRTWDLVAGKEIATAKAAKPWVVEQIQLSANGRYMAVAGWGGTYEGMEYLHRRVTRYSADPNVYVYDTRNGKLLRTIRCNLNPSLPIGMSSDGASLAVQAPYGVKLWHCQGAKSPLKPVAVIDGASRCNFSADGKQLAAFGTSLDDYLRYYAHLQIVEASTGKRIKGINVGKGDLREIREAPAFSPSCKSVVHRLPDPKDRVTIINLSTLQKLFLPNSDEAIGTFCFPSDGGRLAGVRIDSYLDPDSNRCVRIWEIPSDGPAKSLDPSTKDNAALPGLPKSLRGSSEAKGESVTSSSATGRPFRGSLFVASIASVLVLVGVARARIKKAKSVLPTTASLQDSQPADKLSVTCQVIGPPLPSATTAMHTGNTQVPLVSPIVCPSCGMRLRAPEGLRHATKVSCKGCRHVFRFGETKTIAVPIATCTPSQAALAKAQ